MILDPSPAPVLLCTMCTVLWQSSELSWRYYSDPESLAQLPEHKVGQLHEL